MDHNFFPEQGEKAIITLHIALSSLTSRTRRLAGSARRLARSLVGSALPTSQVLNTSNQEAGVLALPIRRRA